MIALLISSLLYDLCQHFQPYNFFCLSLYNLCAFCMIIILILKFNFNTIYYCVSYNNEMLSLWHYSFICICIEFTCLSVFCKGWVSTLCIGLFLAHSLILSCLPLCLICSIVNGFVLRGYCTSYPRIGMLCALSQGYQDFFEE